MTTPMRQSLIFTAPYQLDVIEESLPTPLPGQLFVRTIVSAISAGTEMLFYRGLAPAEGGLDSSIVALAGEVQYPLRYGYAVVGEVVGVGAQMDDAWIGRHVFAFHPHTSHFAIDFSDCIPVPHGMDPSAAVLLPNMETAVNLVMDGEPLIGERVAIFGQGIVGLLAAHLLAKHPIEQLITLDRYSLRREMSCKLGATASLDPSVPDLSVPDLSVPDLSAPDPNGELLDAELRDFDLAYELSGHPATLNQAINATGFAGRVVIGSWYGEKEARINLGGYFHRSRIRLISSQVSTLSPAHHARWDKDRRIQTAWTHLAQRPELTDLITHRFPIADAAEAFRLIDEEQETLLQVLLTY